MDRRWVMAVAAVAIVAGCAGDTTDPVAQPAGAPVGLRTGDDLAATPITEIVGFDDGYEHVIVTTSASRLASVEPAPADAAAVASGPSGLTGELIVRSGAEQRTVVFADGQLEAVMPTPEEQVQIDDALAVGMIALVVVDVDGVAGTAGARYLSLDGELVALDQGADDPGAQAAAAAPDAAVAVRSDDEIVADIESLGGVMAVDAIAPGLFAVATDGDVPELAAVPGVASVTPDVPLGLTDEPEQHRQWAIANTGDTGQSLGYPTTAGFDTGAPYAWEVATGEGVVVAVIDSGVQLDHPDLADRIAVNAADPCGDGRDDDGNGFVDDCRGWDFGANDNDPSPGTTASNDYHGTHVAGIVAAGRNGVGVAGVAPDARIMPLRVSTANGGITVSRVVAAIQYATDHGADVINLSLSTGPNVARSSMTAMETGIRYAGERGVLVVAGAGNNSTDTTTATAWPSSYSDIYPYVMGIGATAHDGSRASFSNYGSSTDLFAPGLYIYSTMPGGTYNWLSGTSMATPAVAGAAAVLLSQQDRSPEEVRERLVGTAMASAAGPSLDLAAAVGASRDRTWTVTYRDVTGLTADTAGGFSIDVRGRMPGAVALRVSVATLDQGEVAAVAGVTASFAGPAGTIAAASDDGGAFAPFELVGDLESGMTFDVSGLALPAGRYALVNELVTGMGATVGELQAVFLTVGESGSSVSTTVPVTDPVTPTTPAPDTVAPTTTQPAATTTVPASSGGGGGGAQPTTTVATGTGTGTGTGGGGAGTTIPSRPAGGGTTETTVAGSPTTTSPSNGSSSGTTGTTTPGSATTTVPAGGTSSTVPSSTVPMTTTPPPAPDQSGDWEVTGMEPRLGPVSGGTPVVITGRFPTWVPVYVWFGDSAIVRATSYGDRLELETPAVSAAAVVDVSVLFRTSDEHELVLSRAFTYAAPQSPGDGSGSGSTGGSSGGSGGSASTTQPNQVTTTTTAPTTTAPTSTGPASTTTVPANTTAPTPNPTSTTSTTTVAAPPGDGGGSSGGDTSWTRQRGSLTLRPVGSGSSLSRVSASRWPSTACTTTCTGTTL